MPTVPVPRVTGQTVAEAPMPGVRISGGNPDFGQSIGGAIATAGLKSLAHDQRMRAEEESYEYSRDGKNALDAAFSKLTEATTDRDGNLVPPDYKVGIAELDRLAKSLLEGVRGGVQQPIARLATQRDLLGYTMSLRGKMQTMEREYLQKKKEADAWTRGESVVQNPFMTPEERAVEILKSAKDYAIATKDQVAGAKFYDKLLKDSATFDWLARVNVAESESDLDGLMQNLQTEGRALGPQGALQIRAEIDRKRESMVKAQNAARKADEESADKMLTDLSARGQLTPAIVETMRPRLSADAYRRWASEPDKVSQRVAEGVDDPDIYRDVQGRIIAASRNAAQLESLRGRIRDLMTGYDPVTHSSGRPGLSRETARQLLNQAEGYLAQIRMEGQRQKTETEKAQDQKYETVRGIITQKIQVQKAAALKDQKAEVEKLEADVLEGLARNKKDPEAYLQQLRKDRPNLFKPVVPPELQFYVQPKGSAAPDWDAAAKRIYDDYRRGFDKATDANKKRALTEQYTKDYERLKRFRGEWDAAH